MRWLQASANPKSRHLIIQRSGGSRRRRVAPAVLTRDLVSLLFTVFAISTAVGIGKRVRMKSSPLTASVDASQEDLDDERLARNQGKYMDNVAFGDSIDASCENVGLAAILTEEFLTFLT